MMMAMGLVAGCSSNQDEPETADNRKTELRIVAGIDMQAEAQARSKTRAVETAWEENDKIGVYITGRNNTTIYEEGGVTAANLEYTFDDGTNYETYGNTYRLFTPTTRIYLPSSSVDLYGYYPYTSAEVEPTAFPIDVSIQTSQKAIDFMRAKTGNVSNENTRVEMLFYHRLVKLVFNLKQGEGLLPDELKDATSLTMKIGGQPVEATYNIYTDAFIIEPSSNDIIPVRASSAPTGYVRTFEAIVLPNGGNNPAGPRTVTITFYRKKEDTIVNTFIIPEATYFTSGYKYTFNVTVNATSIQVDPLKYTEQW